MRLLKDEVVEKSAGAVTITLHPVTTSKQARIAQLSSVEGTEGKVALANYALREVVQRVVIDGVDYNPTTLVDAMDMSDADSVKEMVIIGELTVAAAFAGADAKKKSEG